MVEGDLDALSGPYSAGGHRIGTGLEADQAVLADPAQVLVGDQVGLVGKRQQCRPVGLGADPDHLAVGAVDLGAADRQPERERAVELGDRVETASGDDVVADDVDLSLDPALPGGSVGGRPVRR